MLAHNLPQTKSKRTEQKTTWQREPALDLPAEPETTMDDSTTLLCGHQLIPEPTIQNREPGHWIKLYELSVTNDEPHIEDAVRSESSFNSNYARHAFLREDIWEIPDEMLESYPPCFLDSKFNPSADLPTNIQGSPKLQSAIKSLVAEYHTIFSRNLSKEPAKVSPFSFEVKEEEWRHRRNQSRVRRYDSSKTKIISEYVEKLFAAGVITTSTADYYSHGFVVPKSTEGQWRFVVDFKNLNKVSSAEHWPIPNIATLLRRIGDRGATIFNVMDLTSGYFQAPIAEEVQKYTSFMTDTGCYKWTRLPMGPKGAGSYFQRTMTQEVFHGFIQIFAELYLDDLLVYASTEEECITNLRKIFQRCKDFNLTLHPDKCKFGLSEVEYVGHKLDHEGVHFTRDRLDSVFNFKQPTTLGELKSFLGFAGYFQEHVHHFQQLAKPLHLALTNYDKKKKSQKIKWTDELRAGYEALITAVHECPKLHFLDDHSPIFLHTDASDYGIGAYLFQVRGETRYPIAFLSKSLNDRMCRWDTAQKEGYAIFYAFDKWDHLLRNRFFTLRTDHDNLLRLKESHASNKKVQRWMTAFQHYDYNIEHIKGSLNVEADTLSRNCESVTKTLSNSCLQLKLEQTSRIIPLCNSTIKPILPADIYEKIAKVHSGANGHLGARSMFERLKHSNIMWKGMRKDINTFNKHCPACQKNNQVHNKNVAFPFKVHGDTLMDKVDIDFIVGLRPDDKGFDTIMTIIDSFSRWVHLIPMIGLNATNAAEAIINHCGVFGIPKRFTHDNDRILIGNIVKETITILGTKAEVSLAYSKEEQGIVERANKEVMKHLRNFIFDHMAIKSWSRYIPLVQRIMNSSTHKSTGFPPSVLLFGHALDLNRNLISDTDPIESTEISYNQWIQETKDMQLFALGLAKKFLNESAEMHFENYPSNQTHFSNGSYVLVEYENKFRRGPNSKLLPFLKGPFLVISSTKSRYRLRNLLTMREKEYHVKRLSKFNLDIEHFDPTAVALRDDGELFIVDKISDIKGNPKGPKSKLFFKVHWVGFTEPTWEPWSRVRTTIKLKEFLTHKSEITNNNRFKNLIPKHIILSSGEHQSLEESSEESEDDQDILLDSD